MTKQRIVSGHKEKMEKSFTLMAKRLHLVCKSDKRLQKSREVVVGWRSQEQLGETKKSRVGGRNKQIAAIEILTPDIGLSL